MSYSGVGAIIRDKDDWLVTVVDTRYWTNEQGQDLAEKIPYVERVKMSLGISLDLKKPPEGKELDNGKIEGYYIPTVLFPSIFKCKRCDMLHQNLWNRIEGKSFKKVNCIHCNSPLEQVNWCAISTKGELSDVPWHQICHEKTENKCEIDYADSYLKLTNAAGGNLKIECTRCGTVHPNVLKSKFSRLKNIQPWIYEKGQKLSPNEVSIVEVNNPNIYSPLSVSALVIPPESRIDKTTIVNRLYNNSKFRRDYDGARNKLQKNRLVKQASTMYRCSSQDIYDAIFEIESGYPHISNIEVYNLYKDEYDAFLTIIDDISDEEDFVTAHRTDEWNELSGSLTGDLKSLSKLIDRLVSVKRLREIQVLKGFTRLPPPNDTETPVAGTEDDLAIQEYTPPDIVGESNWLPSIELFGEGIFLTINQGILSKWEISPSVRKRAEELAERYESSNINFSTDLTITPRFLLLHTLAHLLIRELETVSGYPAASLKERIYHSRDDQMAGILIYTAAPDIAGTLGGIVESTEPKEFLKLLAGAINHAQWCSLDPVCTEHLGQGPTWLNRAACHACTLLPETSCEYRNLFLDRVFIKGSDDLEIPNIMHFIEEVSYE